MEFNNPTNDALGICQDIDFLCGSTTASYPIADKVRNVNVALNSAFQKIWSIQDGWFLDDSNRTDYPKILATLTHGTQDYRAAALSTVLRHIKRIEVQTSDGTWQKLKPFDLDDTTTAKEEYMGSSGMPRYYGLEGGYIALYPTPNSAYATMASGMGIYCSRAASLFTTASTTASPGIASEFHRLLSYAAALDFEKDTKQQRLFLQIKTSLEKNMVNFYSRRFLERPNSIRPSNRRGWRQYL